MFLTEIELSEPIHEVIAEPATDGRMAKKTRVLIRLHHQPIGYVVLDAPSTSAEQIRTAIWDQLAPEINDHLAARDEPSLGEIPTGGLSIGPPAPVVEFPFISVVIPTIDRPEKVDIALKTIAALDYPSFEIIVVENGQCDDRTRNVVETHAAGNSRIRYVHEPIAGSSRGRNRGVKESRGEIVAFVDDDVRVDHWWLQAISRGFQRTENVGCVTGLVLAASLETAAQLYVDQRLVWGADLKPRTFDLKSNRDDSPLYPYSAGIFGTGANFAIRRSVFQKIGGFDEALGPPTPAVGGEDIDMFLRVVQAGFALVREPAAIVHHEHYADFSVLHRQMFNYGRGFTSYLAKHLFHPRTALDVLSRIPRGAARIRKAKEGAESLGIVPPELVAREFLGMFMGPFGYLKSVHRLRRLVRAGEQPNLF